MANRHYFTDEQKAELLSNPYTARITDCKVTFNLAFKQLVMENIDKPGMSASRIFELAGYSKDLFSYKVKAYVVNSICKEAASPKGLQEPKLIKHHMPCKKHSETEFRELQERVAILEQQVEFLKKSQSLKSRTHLKPPASSS